MERLYLRKTRDPFHRRVALTLYASNEFFPSSGFRRGIIFEEVKNAILLRGLKVE